MSEHELKTDPPVFAAVLSGEKTYEIRRDDRGYQVGDVLHLRETEYTGEEMRAGAPLVYTGRSTRRRVTHLLRGPVYGLQDGWAILSVAAAQDSGGTEARPQPEALVVAAEIAAYLSNTRQIAEPEAHQLLGRAAVVLTGGSIGSPVLDALRYYADPATYEQVDVLGRCGLSDDEDEQGYGARARRVLLSAASPQGDAPVVDPDDLPPLEVVEVGATYRHYKGGLYRVIDTATIEATGERAVLYRPVDAPGTIWVRPIRDFVARISPDTHRFAHVAAPAPREDDRVRAICLEFGMAKLRMRRAFAAWDAALRRYQGDEPARDLPEVEAYRVACDQWHAAASAVNALAAGSPSPVEEPARATQHSNEDGGL